MRLLQLLRNLRSYYRGCRDRELQEFYDLESRLPYFDQVSRILCAHKRHLLQAWISTRPVQGPILELGSGIGTFARQLSRQGYPVVAIDISAAKITKAQRLSTRDVGRGAAPVYYVSGDLRELGRGTGLDLEIQQLCHGSTLPKFDVILAADVLEHLPETPCQTLQYLRCLLAPHGRFFTSVPSRLCRHDPGHFWTLLPEEWEPAFRASGFRIQRRQMSHLCWFGLPTPLPLAMVYELHPIATEASCELNAPADTRP
jgi:2-polyprenyl-3-methyl-5-hydroxy-6-metoxy-1,4-benzoquinol methylase